MYKRQALAQANVGLAMNSGTTAAKEAANMVDLDSDPTKILEDVYKRQDNACCFGGKLWTGCPAGTLVPQAGRQAGMRRKVVCSYSVLLFYW